MAERSAYHEAFTQSLGGDEEALVPFLADPTHLARARVYRNNVVTAWADAIFKGYPAIERLVGTEFMRAAAVAFVKAHPPKDPVLALYGAGFADFLEGFEPGGQLPYLADVARLEWAWMETFFALNTAPLQAADLDGLHDAAVSVIAPGLHPSVRLLTSKWNAWEIWTANKNDAEDDEARDTALTLNEMPSAALLWWSNDGVTDRSLTESEYAFLKAIGNGATFGNALMASAENGDVPALFEFFSEALGKGVFAAQNGPTVSGHFPLTQPLMR